MQKTNLRILIQIAAIWLCSVTLPSSYCIAAKPKKPNFIIIFADDLGYGDIEGFGIEPSPFKTPRLSKMAQEGAKLTHFYVTTPYCSPSRASLLTGRYPFRNGMWDNPDPETGVNDFGLPQKEITIAEALKSAGYATKCIGKWHLGHIPKYLPRQQGFDEYYGILYSNDMRPVQIVENETVVEYPVVQATLTKRYTEKAVDFIERSVKADKPFFLYLPHAMPHKPLAASEDFYTPQTPDNLYADVMSELDWSVGTVLDKLQELDIDDNTFVVFTSDNGPWFGGSTGGLRGMKGKTWEGGLRVPMIARWPDKIPGGIVNDAMASTMDLLPTILKAADVKIPDDRLIDGKDIMPLLQSGTASSPHEALFSVFVGRPKTVLCGPWRLHVGSPGPIRIKPGWIDPRRPDGVYLLAPYEQPTPEDYPGCPEGAAPQEMMLYHIINDPSEQHDISKQHPDIVKKLKAMYDTISLEVPDYPPIQRTKDKRWPRGGQLRYDQRVDSSIQ